MTTSTNYTMQSGIRRSQMITAVAEGSEGKLLILGLSRKNIEKLMEGMPIFKTAEELRAPISVAPSSGRSKRTSNNNYRC